MRGLRAAVQFLTVLPLRGPGVEPWRAAAWFPVVGAALGAAGAGILALLEPLLPAQIRALLVVAFWIGATGALHEDGLADVADGVRAERSRERMLEILKDSRIGAFGALALILSVAVRWQALAALAVDALPALTAVMALSRASIVVLARIARPAGAGMGARFAGRVTTLSATAAAALALAAAAWCGVATGAVLAVVTAVVILASRSYFHRRLGGVTGDCLGAVAQLVEMSLLTVLACRSCIS